MDLQETGRAWKLDGEYTVAFGDWAQERPSVLAYLPEGKSILFKIHPPPRPESLALVGNCAPDCYKGQG